jgi:hypothetical protein
LNDKFIWSVYVPVTKQTICLMAQSKIIYSWLKI